MARRRVVLEFSSARMELAVYAGRTLIASRSECAECRQVAADWPNSVGLLRARLREWVVELGVVGASTVVVYGCGDPVTSVSSYPVSAGTSNARRAAALSLSEAARFSIEANPSDVQVLCTDAAARLYGDGRKAEPGPATAARQVHVLAIAETEQTSAAVFDLVASVGLRPRAMVPSSACLTAWAVECALGCAKEHGVSLVLGLGETGSVLVGASGGRLRFVRALSIGAETLVDALTNPMQTAGEGAVTLGRDEARELLYRVGIPERGTVIDAARGIDGTRVLPLLQPLLQRCAIEVKQSLRFGFAESERSDAVLTTMSFGGRLARLGPRIADLCGTKQADASGGSGGDAAAATGAAPTSAECGAIAAYEACPSLRVSVTPREQREKDLIAGSRRALVMGATAAALLLAFDAVTTRLSLREAELRLGAFQSIESEYQTAEALRQKLEVARGGVARAEAARRVYITDRAAPWPELMAALSANTPPWIRLESVNMAVEPEGAVCGIQAVASRPGAAEGDESLAVRDYISSLASVPLFSSVKLGATGRSTRESGPVQGFELTLSVVSVPPGALVTVPAEPPAGEAP